MKKVIALVIVIALITSWHYREQIKTKYNEYHEVKEHALTLYGNIDNRNVRLSFSIPERIAEIIPEEGTMVKKGDLLGSLESIRIENEILATKAELEIKQSAIVSAETKLQRMKNGNRPEDITIAKSLNTALEAQVKFNKDNVKRQKGLLKNNAISVQDFELADTNFEFYNALLAAAKSGLNRLVSGERADDILTAESNVLQAKAALKRAEAELKIKEQKLADTKLYAPCDGIIRNRLVEPGEMTSPQNAVLSMSIVSPKWIRCYLSESLLPKVKNGDKAVIKCDGADNYFEGWVGFIAPSAEFTPKNIETEELRTNLVYEIRVYVDDKENILKLGAPATVVFNNILVK